MMPTTEKETPNTNIAPELAPGPVVIASKTRGRRPGTTVVKKDKKETKVHYFLVNRDYTGSGLPKLLSECESELEAIEKANSQGDGKGIYAVITYHRKYIGVVNGKTDMIEESF